MRVIGLVLLLALAACAQEPELFSVPCYIGDRATAVTAQDYRRDGPSYKMWEYTQSSGIPRCK